MIRYKLVSATYQTHHGTSWCDADGKWLANRATGRSSELCTSGVIHFYDHPLIAVICNPVHGAIDNPRLLKIRTRHEVAHDGLKGGCKWAVALEELDLPRAPAPKPFGRLFVRKSHLNQPKQYAATSKRGHNAPAPRTALQLAIALHVLQTDNTSSAAATRLRKQLLAIVTDIELSCGLEPHKK